MNRLEDRGGWVDCEASEDGLLTKSLACFMCGSRRLQLVYGRARVVTGNISVQCQRCKQCGPHARTLNEAIEGWKTVQQRYLEEEETHAQMSDSWEQRGPGSG